MPEIWAKVLELCKHSVHEADSRPWPFRPHSERVFVLPVLLVRQLASRWDQSGRLVWPIICSAAHSDGSPHYCPGLGHSGRTKRRRSAAKSQRLPSGTRPDRPHNRASEWVGQERGPVVGSVVTKGAGGVLPATGKMPAGIAVSNRVLWGVYSAHAPRVFFKACDTSLLTSLF